MISEFKKCYSKFKIKSIYKVKSVPSLFDEINTWEKKTIIEMF